MQIDFITKDDEIVNDVNYNSWVGDDEEVLPENGEALENQMFAKQYIKNLYLKAKEQNLILN